jgi:hypothetical protein
MPTTVESRVRGGKAAIAAQKQRSMWIYSASYVSLFTNPEIQALGRVAALTTEARANRIASFQASAHAQGSKNSQYGTMWITNGINNIKISKDSTVPEGWRKGRVVKNSV